MSEQETALVTLEQETAMVSTISFELNWSGTMKPYEFRSDTTAEEFADMDANTRVVKTFCKKMKMRASEIDRFSAEVSKYKRRNAGGALVVYQNSERFNLLDVKKKGRIHSVRFEEIPEPEGNVKKAKSREEQIAERARNLMEVMGMDEAEAIETVEKSLEKGKWKLDK